MLQQILKDLSTLNNVWTIIPVDLWRAVRKNQRILEPRIEKRKIIIKGRVIGETPIDIETYDVQTGLETVKFVNCRSGGLSTFDRKVEQLSGEFWILPEKTPLPDGLVVTQEHYNQRFDATHYSIKATDDMPLAEFNRLLDILAEHAKIFQD